MPPRTIYVETSVIGYAATRSVADPLTNSRLEFTRQWLDRARLSPGWKLFTSQAVITEVSLGDPAAARERLDLASELLILDVFDRIERLADRMLAAHALPSKARIDALHIATAAYHGVDFLVTWNCAHIANVATRFSIEEACRDAGYEPPMICTPEELDLDAPP